MNYNPSPLGILPGAEKGMHHQHRAASPVWFACLLVLLLFFAPFARAASTLNFPRLSFEPGTLTGLAIVNPTGQDALVTITAYGADGQPLAGIVNPVELTVPANQQIARLASELFGAGTDPAAVAWFQATSPVDDLTGFFLFLNFSFTLLDGADLPVPAQKIVFPNVRLDSGRSTELNIINPGIGTAELQVQLVRPDSTPLSRALVLPPRGAARLDVATFFGLTEVPAQSYVSVTSTLEVAGFEFIKSADGDLEGLNGRSAAEQLTHLYFPQMVVLGPWETRLGVVNTSTLPVILTISAFKPDGSLYGTENLQNNPVTRALNPGAILAEDVAEMFGFTGEQAAEGWLRVEATSASITGFLSYGVPDVGLVATVTPSRQGQTRAIISHIATISGFFTGIAALNAGQLANNIRILAMKPSGEMLGAFDTVLQPGQRISRLVDDLIPAAREQNGGLIWVRSEFPIFLSSLFGSSRILSNVPPQPAPLSFAPDAGLTSIRIDPPLAIVQPGKAQLFRVEGDGQSAVWKVNGTTGGSPALGTINEQGVYTAPLEVPTPRVLTVSAQTTSQTAGASVDVLDKAALLFSETIVQSVAYLGSLQKLYTAELAVLGTAVNSSGPAADRPEQETTNSEIFEIPSPGVPKLSLAAFSNEKVSKMIGFRASNGREFLLLAAQTSGRVVRLDPQTRQTKEVAGGLNQPSSLVIDPVSGNLLVAEKDKVTTIFRNELETGLLPAARTGPAEREPERLTLVTVESADGVAVDQCTGNVYISNSAAGVIYQFLATTRRARVFFSGLSQPGQLLSLYRSGVSCPISFQLLVIEQGADRVTLLTPFNQGVNPWVSALDSNDLSFLPKVTPFASSEAIVLTELLADEAPQQDFSSSVIVVEVPDLYTEEPDNPPEEKEIERDINLDPALAAIVRKECELGPDEPITKDCAESLNSLAAGSKGVSDLSGLQNFVNLKTLDLSGNSISGLSPLSGLIGLTSLDLASNDISNASALSGLTNLRFLDLSQNQVSDIGPLSGLTALTELNVSRNRLGNLDGVSGMANLENLIADSNRITNIGGVSGLSNLKELQLRSNAIWNLSPLSSLGPTGLSASSADSAPAAGGRLRVLDLGRNNITTIGALSGVVSLVDLVLDNNFISGISALSDLTNLGLVDLTENRVGGLGSLLGNTGIGRGDRIKVRRNNLDKTSCLDIFALVDRGASVEHDVDCAKGEVILTEAGPDLMISSEFARAGATVTLSVRFTQSPEKNTGAAAFSIDFDQSFLTFDTTDSNGDGIAEAISPFLASSLIMIVLPDLTDGDGEIDIALVATPPNVLPEGLLFRITFGVKSGVAGTARIKFSQDPAVSLGTVSAQTQAIDETASGEVVISQ